MTSECNRKNWITWLVFAIAIIFPLIAPPVSRAQNPPATTPAGGTLQGTVTHTDDQGQLSVVQGVQLKLTPESGSAALTAVTDDHGHYSFTGLSAGNYTLEGTLEGFQPYKAVLKVVDVPLVQDFTMQISGVTQSVEVKAEAEAMSTENANSNPTITA